MKPKFDTDFKYDEWYEKKREEDILKQFGESDTNGNNKC